MVLYGLINFLSVIQKVTIWLNLIFLRESNLLTSYSIYRYYLGANMITQKSFIKLTVICLVAGSAQACAHGIKSPVDSAKQASFDITKANATTNGRLTTFMMEVASVAGDQIPVETGKLEGAKVDAYVWPTSLDPSVVGFDPKSGILALAITAHPDFDDTPLFDENNDGDLANDGKTWHSHWVVLVDEPACGANLTVRDISPGKNLLPNTAPELPIALDSPGMSPSFSGHVVRITMPINNTENINFDAVTAELQVSTKKGTPFLCVVSVRDIASGDLSLPGKVISE